MIERIRRLEGVRNFRDFGAYRTRDGGHVRPGVLFRSAHFAEATPADRAHLDALGVQLVVDLRRPQERAFQPNAWPPQGGGVRMVFNGEGDDGLPPHLALLTRTDLAPDHVRDFMLGLYDEMAFESRHIALFAETFSALAAPDAPEGGIVIHCAAGKDRTGLLCALILEVLGVDVETVTEDYALTNVAVDIDVHLPEIHARIEAAVQRRVDARALRPMLGVEREYLTRARAAIAARHGDAEAYAREVLGQSPEALARMRSRLVA